MNWLTRWIDIILHIDSYIGVILSAVGNWTYLLLFLIVLAETGLVLTPFLPGDSLLFATGAFAAQGYFHLLLLLGILCIAAITGDSMNYSIGLHLGEKVLLKRHLINPAYLEKTKLFYEKYGKKTIILARFVPIVRTFAPFIAGIGKMKYQIFLFYNIIGGILWVSFFVLAGYFFGNIPFVQQNFSIFVIAIIILSFVPLVIEFIKYRLHNHGRQK